MATSKYVRASFALPFAKFAFAEETRWEMGVSEGISDGEMAMERGNETREAPRAREENRVIMMERGC